MHARAPFALEAVGFHPDQTRVLPGGLYSSSTRLAADPIIFDGISIAQPPSVVLWAALVAVVAVFVLAAFMVLRRAMRVLFALAAIVVVVCLVLCLSLALWSGRIPAPDMLSPPP
jgi:hypothetical protein